MQGRPLGWQHSWDASAGSSPGTSYHTPHTPGLRASHTKEPPASPLLCLRPPHCPLLWGRQCGGCWEGDPGPVPFSRAGGGSWGLGGWERVNGHANEMLMNRSPVSCPHRSPEGGLTCPRPMPTSGMRTEPAPGGAPPSIPPTPITPPQPPHSLLCLGPAWWCPPRPVLAPPTLPPVASAKVRFERMRPTWSGPTCGASTAVLDERLSDLLLPLLLPHGAPTQPLPPSVRPGAEREQVPVFTAQPGPGREDSSQAPGPALEISLCLCSPTVSTRWAPVFPHATWRWPSLKGPPPLGCAVGGTRP